ncbi:MAG: hypothetical protein Q4F54_02665 [Coriobacteriia bacterium]|nr:hypothetical protein [Coriobacteriia bacterium]
MVELVITLRKSRKKIDEVHAQLTPTIENIEQITTKIQPAIDRVDPLIERVSLSIDAANLELMRVDQIMENVNQISENAAKATNSVGNLVNAPADLLNKASNKIVGLFGGGKKSEYIGQLEEGDNIDQIVNQSRSQGRKFGRKVVKNDTSAGQTATIPQNVNNASSNPYVSFN